MKNMRGVKALGTLKQFFAHQAVAEADMVCNTGLFFLNPLFKVNMGVCSEYQRDVARSVIISFILCNKQLQG